MKELIDKIKLLDFGITGDELSSSAIIHEQTALKSCGFPQIPDEVLEFLKYYNGFLAEGRCIFGIDIKRHFLYDILGENVTAENPNPNDILLLGTTATTCIAWRASKQDYLLIDKSTFMVLHKFKDFKQAVKYILKIDD